MSLVDSARLPPDEWRRPGPLLAEWFALLNFGFLSVDVYLAHSVNEFAHRSEWVPLYFGGLAAAALLPGVVRRKLADRAGWVAGLAVGLGGVLIGVTGLVLHLENSFFARQTLKDLVYTAPFSAPLSFAGLGLLVLLNRLERGRDWGQWVMFLALGGFVGVLSLSLADHAQNGFFHWLEWVPVASSAFAVSFLLVALSTPRHAFLRLSFFVMLLQVAVGVVGLALHGSANLARSGEPWDRFVYGAPVFAPLLFADLAALASIGLWCVLRYPAAGAAPHGDSSMARDVQGL
jgi:hypothetical protein